MSNVSDVLATKGNDVITIDSNSTVFEAVIRMVRAGIGALAVVDAGRLVGVITERDYLRKIAVEGRTSRTTLVREIMAHPVVCAHGDDAIEDCLTLMTEKRIRHLPILDGFRLAGLVSIGDLVRRQLEDQRGEIGRLVEYIQTGGVYLT